MVLSESNTLIEEKIVSSDTAGGDRFGQSVSISGNYAIVGADYEDTGGSNAGSAYIFEIDVDGSWNQVQKIQASDRGGQDYFGCSVSISGNYAIVGAYNKSSGTGAAYIFERNENGTWPATQTQKIQASNKASNDKFGVSVSISGNYAVVGANEKSSGRGAAYIF